MKGKDEVVLEVEKKNCNNEMDKGKICSNCKGKGKWTGLFPEGQLRNCHYCKGTGLNPNICIVDEKEHDWVVKKRQEWSTSVIEKGEIKITAQYLSDIKKCSKCKKVEFDNGSVVTRSGTEYILEKDGSWGMCLGNM